MGRIKDALLTKSRKPLRYLYHKPQLPTTNCHMLLW